MSNYQGKQVKRLAESFTELDQKHKQTLLDEIKYQGALSAAEEVSKTTTTTFGDLLPAVIQQQKYFNKIEGFTSGLAYFDDAIMGFRPGELIVIAGPSNFGKTMVGLNLVINTSVMQNKKVLIISMEMTAQQIAQRIYNITNQHEKIARNVIIQTELSVSTKHIKAMIERHKPQLVLIDHIQFLANQESGSEYERITSAVASLKRLAVTQAVPIIAISHIAKTRSGKEGQATAADLKGSSSIEQDCDVGIMINRPAGGVTSNQIILTLFKHRTKSPMIFFKDCILTLEGVKITSSGGYTIFGEESITQVVRNLGWST